MKSLNVAVIVLFAWQTALHPAVAQKPSDNTQDVEGRIESLANRIQDLEEDRQRAQKQANDLEAGLPLNDPLPASRGGVAALRARANSDADEILFLSRQIEELKRGESAGDAADRSSNDPLVGIWKVDVSRSIFPSEALKSETLQIASAQDGIKAVDTAVYADGRTVRSEWTVKYNGKDYPIKGAGMRTIAISRSSDHFFNFTIKENGHVTTSGQIVCSPDRASQTMTGTSIDARGSQTRFAMFWDRSARR